MSHLILLVAMVVTCALAAVVNVVVGRLLGIDLFTLKIWLVVPVGAIILGFLGTSGAVLAARHFNIRPKAIDAMLMIAVSAVTMALIYYIDYATFVLDDGSRASELLGFATYLDLILTMAHMRMGRGLGIDTGEVGQMGYYLAGIEFIGFIVGGVLTFAAIKGQWCCSHCGSYLRKIKISRNKYLTMDEGRKIIEIFEEGNIEEIPAIVAWEPEEPVLDGGEKRITIAFNLFGCPKCKAETISTSVAAFNGTEWKEVPSLTIRRDLSSGLSLRNQFA